MDCQDFLERYSDYRDGLIADPETYRSMCHHRSTCPRCARYDAVISRGLAALRSLGELEPSFGFPSVLKQRLELDSPIPRLSYTGSVAATLLVLAGAMLFVLEGIAASAASGEREAALPAVVVNPGVPFVSFSPAEATAGGGESGDFEPFPGFARWTTAP